MQICRFPGYNILQIVKIVKVKNPPLTDNKLQVLTTITTIIIILTTLRNFKIKSKKGKINKKQKIYTVLIYIYNILCLSILSKYSYILIQLGCTDSGVMPISYTSQAHDFKQILVLKSLQLTAFSYKCYQLYAFLCISHQLYQLFLKISLIVHSQYFLITYKCIIHKVQMMYITNKLYFDITFLH
eukprot:TRINITY_DN13077_c2_g1_i1.p1 TRINITY_DN13077_c2_g1~~TRINITY_DN13077_c2_g1_i1.p1  ORF type:complete len:185 (+),score=-28.31 TRINITY_DN13077_c2_g1_i1:217-771(+)